MIARYMQDVTTVSGDVKQYVLDPPFDSPGTPLHGAVYLLVAVIDWPKWNLVETQVFPCIEQGVPIPLPDLTLGVVLKLAPHETEPIPPATKPTLTPLSHDEALLSLGYTSDYTPWPEPEPTYKMIRALQVLTLTDPMGNVLELAEGQEVMLPIPVADNLIAQGAVEAVEES